MTRRTVDTAPKKRYRWKIVLAATLASLTANADQSTTVTIINDSLSVASMTIPGVRADGSGNSTAAYLQNAGAITLALYLLNAPRVPVTVQVQLDQNSYGGLPGAVYGTQYTLSPGPDLNTLQIAVQFSAGEPGPKFITLNLINYAGYSGSDWHVLKLTPVPVAGQYTAGGSAIINMRDVNDNIISVSGGTAQKVTTAAAFTFTRGSGSGVYPQMTVPYTIDPSSTAVPNLDYTSPLSNPGSVTFQANQTTLSIPVTPQWNPNQTGTRYITLDLTPSPTRDYRVVTPPNATVAILDDKPPKNAVSVYALVVGGSSDPWTTVDASLVGAMTVNGGVAAVGSTRMPRIGPNPNPTLTIQPDVGFLGGNKIPPLTPNVFDIRIMTSNESLSSQ